MAFENLQKWFQSDAGRQVLAEVAVVDATEHDELAAQYADAQCNLAAVAEAHTPLIADAVADEREKLAAYEAAKIRTRMARHQALVDRGPIEHQLGTLEKQLRLQLPTRAAEVLAALDAELARVREQSSRAASALTVDAIPRQGPHERKEEFAGYARRIGLLQSVRVEYAEGLHLLPFSELESRLQRIEAAIAG